ncbi:MAG: GntR family transcriptional regulator [Cytophagales bacterium]|nr:GntR family transcriptional regulator [Cytophagales bacterium]
MRSLISINETSKIPKYKQIVNSVLMAIGTGGAKHNDKLPSVNELLVEYDISRDTIHKAYEYLKKKKVVYSIPGKGYYISENDFVLKVKVFLLFNKLSDHKRAIYESFSREIGDLGTIEFFVYDNNYNYFKELIKASKKKDYTHYVIISHFEEGGDNLEEFLRKEIPLDKLIILDKKIPGFTKNIGCVYQDFENDIYTALLELNHLLKKFKKIKILFNKHSYHPKEIIKGFVKFCGEYAYEYDIIQNIENEEITPGTVYINLKETDLVALIGKIKKTDYILGKNVGIISYNDTPLKEVLLDGITVISTDFIKLGEQAAQIVLKNEKSFSHNPFYSIIRKSL